LIYRFEDICLDTGRRELRRKGDLRCVEPQVFDLLEYLIRNRDRVVSREDVFREIWKGRFVSESALSTRINAVRCAIGDSGEEQRLIRTLRRKGVRFVGTVIEAQASPAGSEILQPIAAFSVSRSPSIAVLPFTNMSGDPEQECFADGITEEIILRLSRLPSFDVIARNSSFIYKGKSVDVRQVARTLGSRYVLEGSVRVAASRVRLAAALVDGMTGHHVWTKSYEQEIESVFAIQDDLAEQIVGTISANSTPRSACRRTANQQRTSVRGIASFARSPS
jgi:TolB-like protein